MLYTKCILAPIEHKDGVRASVMSRHTLNDGVTPDKTLEDRFDIWIRELAPLPKLVGDYYKRGLEWDSYTKQYQAFLRESKQREIVFMLAERSMREDITLLCIEAEPVMCHRRLLAEECKLIVPSLVIGVY